jgi:hypothetical protein
MQLKANKKRIYLAAKLLFHERDVRRRTPKTYGSQLKKKHS